MGDLDDVSPATAITKVTVTVTVEDAALMAQLEIGLPSMEIQKNDEAQADPSPVDDNAVAKINKSRADHAVVLALLSNGDFADHIHGSRIDRIHAHGKRQMCTGNVIVKI